MSKKYKVGDWVEVRSKEEILRTLDAKGQLDGTPFMPEMFQYCGQRFQVYKRAHKTCDYSTKYPYHTRRLADTVHLETRCDGAAHDGCQAGCLLYWKHAWLKPVGKNSADLRGTGSAASATASGCNEAAIWNNTKVSDPAGGAPTYVCQITQVPYATTPLAWWDIRQYFQDYASGNSSLGSILGSFFYSAYYHLSQAGIGLGGGMRWLYDKVSPKLGGTLFPRKPGLIPDGMPTPKGRLDLQPGELVRIKPHLEILKTVGSDNRNRGMYWDAELVPYCGGTYRVLKSVTKIIDEKTSKMVDMKNPCIILDGVVCRAKYSDCRLLCPKEMYPYWREIWLERAEAKDPQASPSSGLSSELSDAQEMERAQR